MWADREWVYEVSDSMRLESWQKLNHFRNGRELCRKDLLVKNLKRKKARRHEQPGPFRPCFSCVWRCGLTRVVVVVLLVGARGGGSRRAARVGARGQARGRRRVRLFPDHVCAAPRVRHVRGGVQSERRRVDHEADWVGPRQRHFHVQPPLGDQRVAHRLPVAALLELITLSLSLDYKKIRERVGEMRRLSA